MATMAIKQGLKPGVFMSLIFSYPTEAEIFKVAGISLVKNNFKAWLKNLIKLIFVR
ncbi:hypothetical protein ACFL5G_05110 [Candidatus Margulisiibacteriota bacterium]